MSDTQVVETEAPVQEQAEAKPVKQPKAERPCYCSFFEIGNFETEDEVFTTGCDRLTKSVFAQGHDAGLVSFLVGGHIDGYSIRLVRDGVAQSFATPEGAAKTASDALGEKARKATENQRAKLADKETKAKEREAARAAKKAEKEAAAAAKAKAKEEAKAAKQAQPQAEVAAGSREGDAVEVPEGMTRVKVGRWEYDAVINEEDGTATFVDGKGEQQVIERDGYRVLATA